MRTEHGKDTTAGTVHRSASLVLPAVERKMGDADERTWLCCEHFLSPWSVGGCAGDGCRWVVGAWVGERLEVDESWRSRSRGDLGEDMEKEGICKNSSWRGGRGGG